jgi:hypothetical protein
MQDYALPLEARDLLGALVGDRLVGVRRAAIGSEEVTRCADPRDGATELELASGLTLHLASDETRHSVVVRRGPAASTPTPLVDASRDDFWRWRLRRDIVAVHVWKSLDVPADAKELEFGIELELRFTRGVAFEYALAEGSGRLTISDGSQREPSRRLRVG